MHRLGFRHENLTWTLPELLASPNLELEAVYTHFATADEPEHALFDAAAPGLRAGVRHAATRSARVRGIVTPPTAPRCCAIRASGTTSCVRGCCCTASFRRRWHTTIDAASRSCRSPAASSRSRASAPGETVGYGARFTRRAADDAGGDSGGICRRSRSPARGSRLTS